MRGPATHARQLTCAGAVVLGAAGWLVPPQLRPGTLALAALCASAGGRAGGVIAAAVAVVAPVPGPVKAGLVATALVAGELDHRHRGAHRTLRTRTFTDRLTGLRNYDYFSEVMRSELARVRRYGGCMTLVMLDLDRFKAYNDAHGHPAGDSLLAAAAAAWRRELRPTDVLARYGGEEFAAILPACALDDAHQVVERIRSATPSGQTVSAGIAEWDRTEDAAALVARADAALYAAKAAGRDRAHLSLAA